MLCCNMYNYVLECKFIITLLFVTINMFACIFLFKNRKSPQWRSQSTPRLPNFVMAFNQVH